MTTLKISSIQKSIKMAIKKLLATMEHWSILRIGAILLVVSIVGISFFWEAPGIGIFLSLPVILGSLLVIVSSDMLTASIDRWEKAFENRENKSSTKEGKFAKYFSRPLWKGCHAIWKNTENIANRHLRMGVRIAILAYYFGLMIGILVMVAYVAIILIVIIAVFVFGFWLLGKYLDSNTEKNEGGRYREASRSQSLPNIGRARTSRKVEGIFGSRTEHYDKNGQKVAESYARDGVFGDYVEHFDSHGNKIGESRNREGITQDYIEHTNSHAEKIGESRQREGVFESYTEHTDQHGNKTGESRVREGIFQDYIEHKDK